MSRSGRLLMVRIMLWNGKARHYISRSSIIWIILVLTKTSFIKYTLKNRILLLSKLQTAFLIFKYAYVKQGQNTEEACALNHNIFVDLLSVKMDFPVILS